MPMRPIAASAPPASIVGVVERDQTRRSDGIAIAQARRPHGSGPARRIDRRWPGQIVNRPGIKNGDHAATFLKQWGRFCVTFSRQCPNR
jgi:hypothetical protein